LFPVEAIKWLLEKKAWMSVVLQTLSGCILIRIKANVIDSVTLEACWSKPLRWSRGFNKHTMPMQNAYEASVTTHKVETVLLTTLAF
jgi:hypothetical protein